MNGYQEARYRSYAAMCALVLWIAFGSAEAASTFRIENLYSTPDGSHQFIQLRDFYHRPDQASLQGLVLTTTNRYGVVKAIPLADVPRPYFTGQSVLLRLPR